MFTSSAKKRYWVLFTGYSFLGVLAVGIPGRMLWTGGDCLIWGSLQILTLAATLALCWLYLPGFDLPGHSIFRGRPGGQRVAFTFDDGPNGESTEAILDVLLRHNARATFFCVGRQVAAYPDLVQRMVRDGHVVGNHTQEHRKLAWLTRAEIARQLDGCQESISQAGAPWPILFRAPHGVKSLLLRGMLHQRGLKLCAWSQDVRDFECPGTSEIIRRACLGLNDGEIVLMHDGGGDRYQTAAALDEILQECQRRRILPVTLPEILSSPR